MKTTEQTISVPEPTIQTIRLTLVGTASIIQHAWSEKAKRMMLEKQMKKAEKAKAIRDPKSEFESSLYIYEPGKFTYPKEENFPMEVAFSGKLGIPSVWIKKAIVDSCRNVSGLPMTLVRGSVFVRSTKGDLIPVKYDSLWMREDMVKIGMGSSDLRYRGELQGWSVDIEIVLNSDVLSVEQVLNLLKIAGFSCGLGEWRPQRSGDFGTFEVLPPKSK